MLSALPDCGRSSWVNRHILKGDGLGREIPSCRRYRGVDRTVRLVHFCRSTVEIVFVLINVGVRERPLAADAAIPFGPFLAAGGWVVWVNGSVPF